MESQRPKQEIGAYQTTGDRASRRGLISLVAVLLIGICQSSNPTVVSADEQNRLAAPQLDYPLNENALFASLIEQLDHDRFEIRSVAADQLIETNRDDRETDRRLREILADRSSSLETKFAVSEIIEKRLDRRSQRAIARLRDGVGEISEQESNEIAINLPGWFAWQRLLGRCDSSRMDFVAIRDRYPFQFEALEHSASMDEIGTVIQSREGLMSVATMLEARSHDHNTIADPGFWSLVIATRLSMPRSADTKAARLQLDHRLSMVLSNNPIRTPPLRLDARDAGEQVSTPQRSYAGSRSMRRLVGMWLSQTNHTVPRRTAMLIALRCGCQDQAETISHQVLRRTDASPADLVTAMLVLSRKPCPAFRSQFNDTRRAFQWQVIAEDKTVIETQVRDVAIALALDQRGTDIRFHGFESVKADPLLGFQDYSLGFASNETREISLQQAVSLLEREE